MYHCNYERNAGTDVSPCVAVGRDLVHTLFRRDVVEHRVIESQRHGIKDLSQDKYDDEHDPGHREAVQDAACNAERHGGLEKDLLAVLVVGESSANRSEDRHDDGYHRDRDRIISSCLVACDLSRCVADRESLEIDRDQGTGQHREGRISHIIQYPGAFFFAQIAKHRYLPHRVFGYTAASSMLLK